MKLLGRILKFRSLSGIAALFCYARIMIIIKNYFSQIWHSAHREMRFA